MTKQVINLGTAPSGAGGDDRRSAWVKAISNFTELYDFLAGSAGAASLPASLAAAITAAGGYRKATILGAVAQSGGVPTGAIIEKGSNANGEYTKFADGLMVCRLNIQKGIGLTATYGPAYYNVSPWTFPVAFVGQAPYVGLSALCSGRVTVTSEDSINLSSATFNLMDFAGSNTGAYNLSWFAIGRWY